MDDRQTLFCKLQEYGRTDSYPFHMPGHKRQEELGITSFPNPFSVDITEIDGFDNLHRPEGILKESMAHAAGVYGSDRTYYLVNGSSCGILSALCGAVPQGGRVIMARNSHKSAYHAVLLNNMEPLYVFPECINSYAIQGGIDPEAIEAAFSRNGEAAKAVFVTSPTYEGIVTDISAIADIAHKHAAVLIVDEAHGAHFSFGDGNNFPKSALDCGADIVIQSLHKTLPSLTQTAILHIKGERVSIRKLEQYLQIFQSSSPSYVFMSSIDNCVNFMEGQGKEKLACFERRLRLWIEDCEKELRHLKIMTDDIIGGSHVAARDISKILISTKNAPMTGTVLSDILRDRYHLEAEMSCDSYVLIMTSLMDQEEGFIRLKKALLEVDSECVLTMENNSSLPDSADWGKTHRLTWVKNPVKCLSVAKAMDAVPELVPAALAVGRVSAGFITVYPPGIPAVIPGELLTEEAVDLICCHADAGLTVEGIFEDRQVPVIAQRVRKL